MREKFQRNLWLADLFAVDANAFVNFLQMRRSVQPGTETGATENRFQKSRRRAFAIRPGNMNQKG